MPSFHHNINYRTFMTKTVNSYAVQYIFQRKKTQDSILPKKIKPIKKQKRPLKHSECLLWKTGKEFSGTKDKQLSESTQCITTNRRHPHHLRFNSCVFFSILLTKSISVFEYIFNDFPFFHIMFDYLTICFPCTSSKTISIMLMSFFYANSFVNTRFFSLM